MLHVTSLLMCLLYKCGLQLCIYHPHFMIIGGSKLVACVAYNMYIALFIEISYLLSQSMHQ